MSSLILLSSSFEVDSHLRSNPIKLLRIPFSGSQAQLLALTPQLVPALGCMGSLPFKLSQE